MELNESNRSVLRAMSTAHGQLQQQWNKINVLGIFSNNMAASARSFNVVHKCATNKMAPIDWSGSHTFEYIRLKHFSVERKCCTRTQRDKNRKLDWNCCFAVVFMFATWYRYYCAFHRCIFDVCRPHVVHSKQRMGMSRVTGWVVMFTCCLCLCASYPYDIPAVAYQFISLPAFPPSPKPFPPEIVPPTFRTFNMFQFVFVVVFTISQWNQRRLILHRSRSNLHPKWNTASIVRWMDPYQKQIFAGRRIIDHSNADGWVKIMQYCCLLLWPVFNFFLFCHCSTWFRFRCIYGVNKQPIQLIASKYVGYCPCKSIDCSR